ncbi:MAG: chemotaxis protein [Oscillospiraceae bacterium]|nr:chemotaxis protein [Oscillospiraceae bacterium]
MGISETSILLETGTNELEVLEFIIAGNSFGINVAKITELMQVQKIQPMPHSHPCIEGIFQPRAEVYTLIDLAAYLNLPQSENPEKDIYIVANFNKMNVAFHVHAVESIHRISWEAIEKPDSIIYGGDEGVVTGIAKVGGRIISILDFEKITFDISPETGIQLDEVQEHINKDKSSAPILISEDSTLLRKMLLEALRTAGYTNVVSTTNGLEAWNFLESVKDEGDALSDHVCLVITDIEMPQMDGHRLTKLIKTDRILKSIPVIIFSSLIDETMKKKGEEIGADAQLSKPEIGSLVGLVNSMLQNNNR